MKQVLQNLRDGTIEVAEVPRPSLQSGYLLIQTRCSLISSGTERMLVEFGRGSLLQKARQQPERVKQVIEKIKTDGLLPAIEAVLSRLDMPLPLGYSNVGTVIEVGEGVTGFKHGDRVISNGAHAELVCVPKNLCALVPDTVDDETAVFTVVGAVGLQGIRLLNPTMGESVAVIGLGLIGSIAAQMLKADGCRVIGFDIDPSRVELARRLGIEAYDSSRHDPVRSGMTFTGGIGLDGVLIAASTSSNDVVRHAARMCRKRGRIVLVGVAGLQLDRKDFYEKELTFQVSCSYGAGRYDPAYEDKGQDYPIGFVRWTAQRNFQAVLEMMASGKIDIKPLITDRFPLARAPEAYERLVKDRSSLAILLTYPEASEEVRKKREVQLKRECRSEGKCVVGVIGAGAHAVSTLLPALRKSGARLKCIVSASGLTATHAAKKFGFESASSDYRKILDDSEINAVFIATRHDSHASMVIEGLNAGKHIYVEKPLALNREELSAIRAAHEAHPEFQLFVGFNRRFAPHTVKVKELLEGRSEPLAMVAVVNAGFLPAEHWLHDPKAGGGRVIGEACHFIDLLAFLCGSPIETVFAAAVADRAGDEPYRGSIAINLSFADGSIGTVHYLTGGSRRFPKERIEVFTGGKVLTVDNFRRLRGYGWSGFSRKSLWRQDKGHIAAVRAFLERVERGGAPLMPFEQIENTTLATFAAVESARSGEPMSVCEVER